MVYEVDLYPPLLKRFQRDYLMVPEVPLGSKRIDIICARPRKVKRVLNCSSTSLPFNEIVAIEVKVKDWRRALRQSVVYQLCAQKVYVALWHQHLNCVNLQYFEQYGVGIIVVDGDAKIIREAKQSKHVNPEYTMHIQKYILKVSKETKCC